ncbi:MAG TPA: dihydrolipoyl dehydrogenase [bacterium]
MKTYDAVVIGAGDVGCAVAFKAAGAGLSVALVEKGAIGGTCLNNGCVPSKTLIHVADRVLEIAEAPALGIRVELAGADFEGIMARMRETVANGRSALHRAVEQTANIELIPGACRFLAPRTLEVAGTRLAGKKVFVASGSRPAMPPIPGLDATPHLTNETLLALRRRPESLIILGGGYIGLEYGHFFAALGTKVTIVERGERLLPFEEPEVSELLRARLAQRVQLHLGTTVTEVRPAAGGCAVVVRGAGDSTAELAAEQVLVAAGRRSNADELRAQAAGFDLDERGYFRVDDRLRTNKPGVWALGDAIGRAMFTHAGDREAEVAWHNASHRRQIAMDFAAVPHAVFTSPQIASVGLTEAQAAAGGRTPLVGRARYMDTVLGRAMGERDGFAKAIVDRETRRILGFHVIGPQASLLIAEVATAVANRQQVDTITGSMHVFPALSDLVTEAFANLA